jgi:5,10-methenyltetrahydrofolate synthetase
MTINAELKQWRGAHRAALLSTRAAVAPAQRRQWDQAITQSLVEKFALLQRLIVGCYWPYRGEFDPRFVMRHLRHAGARVALPVVVQKHTPLQFREWWPGAPTVDGALGLPAPDGTDVLMPQALLMPPVGFDAQGHRLGYGGGYFDRTLSAMNPQPLKIGVGYEISRMQTIRPQAHDVAMDFIVTEAGVHGPDEHGLTRIDDPWQIMQRARAIIRQRHQVLIDGHGEVHRPVQTAPQWQRRSYASPVCYAQEFYPEDEDEQRSRP